MRLRTLPVSAAGVITGAGCAAYTGNFRVLPFILCLLFALGAQIASNFANEYFDYKNGFDRKGRAGFRRGVTEGDIKPGAMLRATLLTLALTGVIGCLLIIWGGWWLIAVGVTVAIFALAYSAGPWPLSHHGLGELAVIIFFGFVPVVFTFYLTSGGWEYYKMPLYLGGAIGLMGANVLVVNNYRDIDDDRAVGKHTLAVKFGPEFAKRLYFINGIAAFMLTEFALVLSVPIIWQIGSLIYVNLHYLLWTRLCISKGAELNPLLGKTAMLMIFVSVWLFATLAVNNL